MDATGGEFDQVKTEFWQIQEDVEQLKEETCEEFSAVDDGDADELEVTRVAPNISSDISNKLRYPEDLAESNQRSMETFAIRIGEEWKRVRGSIATSLCDVRKQLAALEESQKSVEEAKGRVGHHASARPATSEIWHSVVSV